MSVPLQVVAQLNVKFGDEGPLRGMPLIPVEMHVILPSGGRTHKTLPDDDRAVLQMYIRAVIVQLMPRRTLIREVTAVFLQLNSTENGSDPLQDELFRPNYRMDDDLFTEMLDFIGAKSTFDVTQFLQYMSTYGAGRCSKKFWFVFNLIFRYVVSPNRSVSRMLVIYFDRIFENAQNYCIQGITAAELFVHFTIQGHTYPDMLAVRCADERA